ncbi:MAG: hypothetical protein IJ035_01200 [Oscillospiraceae bacterium]|nr:hypothetical protein [Oscillospiraceae bacterium]
MKKLMRKIAAVSAAVVMSVSVFGANASAEEQLRDSWVMTDKGWTYVMPDGTDVVNKLVKIDGVMYKFGSWAHHYEKYSGWTKSSDGTRRRYSKGLPYTGWLKYKNGQRRYCLDGYMATDNMQIGDHLYTFNEDGFYTGKVALTLITKCDKVVSSDSDEIKVALKNLDGRDYNFGVLSSMERWEKGKWVNCWGDWRGENGEELAFNSIGYFLENKGDMMELELNPQLYTNYNFTEGYYRIPIGSWLGNYKNQYECYAMFQVVPPVTVTMPKDTWLSSDGISEMTSTKITVNSEKLDGEMIYTTVYKMTENGWEDLRKISDFKGDLFMMGKSNYRDLREFSVISTGQGYYKRVAFTDYETYETYFRIEELDATPWLDEYSSKDENLKVYFDVYNKLDRDVEIYNFAYDIYRMENGKWVDPEEARIAYTDVEIGEPTVLKKGDSVTIRVNVSECYDISKLKKGEYAVYINGMGYERFNIVDTALDNSVYPFADFDEDKIEKIVLTEYQWLRQLKYTTRNTDDIVACLSQVQVGEKLSQDVDMEGNIPVGVEIFYNDGTKKEIMFSYSKSVTVDGQRYECNPYAYKALCNLIDEKYEK